MHGNTLLNMFNSTIDRLEKNWNFKGRKPKNQERIDRFEGKCPIPHWQCWWNNKKLEDIDSRVEEI